MSAPLLCSVSGSVFAPGGAPLEGVKIKVNVTTAFTDASGNYIPSGVIASTTSDAAGAWTLPVVQTASLGRSVTFEFVYPLSNNQSQSVKYAAVIPNTPTALFSDLVDLSTGASIIAQAPTTDALAEGIANLYFTEARALAAVATITGQPNGVAALGADGKVPAEQLPAIDTFPPQAGNAGKFLSTDGTDVSWEEVIAGVTSVNGESGAVTLDTSDIAEGANLYHTDSRVDARITAQKAQPSGLATLDASGKVPQAQIPAVAIVDTYVVASQAAMLALGAQGAETGDVAVRTDIQKSFILKGTSPAVLGDWQELLSPTDAVQSVNGQQGTVVLSTDNVAEGSTNKYFTDTRAKAAAVVNSVAGTQTDQAPSVAAVNTANAALAAADVALQGRASTLEKLGPGALLNVSLAPSFVAGGMTLNLLTSAGTAPTSSDPVKVAFRTAAPSNGYVIRTATGTVGMVVPAGASLGLLPGATNYLYQYALDNAGVIEYAISPKRFDEGEVQNTVAISSTSSDPTLLYSTAARTGVAIRQIGRIRAKNDVAGVWTGTGFDWSALSSKESSAAVISPFVTEWQTYPMVISADTTAPTKPSNNLIDKAQWRRTGPDTIQIRFTYQTNSSVTGGSVGSGQYLYSLPPQFSADMNKIPLGIGNLVGVASVIGSGRANDGGNNSNLVLSLATATQFKAYGKWSGNNVSGATVNDFAVGSSVFAVTAPNTSISFLVELPVTQYAGAQSATLITKDPVTSIASLLTTRVTGRLPSALGEYRYLGRSASNVTMTDSAPATAPNAANGFVLYKGNAFNASDTAGAPTQLQVFIGYGKAFSLQAYAAAGKVGAVNLSPSQQGSTNDIGFAHAYDPSTGVVTIARPVIGGNGSAHYVGTLATTGDVQFGNAYGDILVYDNPLAAGLTESTDYIRTTGNNGLGGSSSGDTQIANFTTVLDNRGDAITYVPRTATTGDYWRINKRGTYAISYVDAFSNGAATFGISLNSPNNAANVFDLPAANILSSTVSASANFYSLNAWTGPLEAGSIIRAHNAQGTRATVRPFTTLFSIAKLPSPLETVGAAGGAREISAQAYSNNNLTITNGSPIIFPASNWDTAGIYNASNGRFTAPESGKYRVTFFTSYATGAVFGVSVFKNGAMLNGLTVVTGQYQSPSAVLQMNAGEYITIVPSANSTLFGGGGSQPTLTFEKIN